MLTNNANINIKSFCAPIVHPVTGETRKQYENSRQTHYYRFYGERHGTKNFEIWHRVTNDKRTRGGNSMLVMIREKISRIPEDHTITYVRTVVDFRP